MPVGISFRMLMAAGGETFSPTPGENYIADSDTNRLLDANADYIIEGGESFAPAVSGVSATTIATTTADGDWVGRAAMLELSNGNWVLCYKGATAHAANDGALHIRFSDDKGATWTAEDTKLGGGAVTGFPMNPSTVGAGEDAGEPWLYLAPNGNLILHMWRVDYGVTANGTYQSTSSDNGETWTSSAQVDFTNTAISDSLIFATDDHFIVGGVIYAGARQYDDATPTNCKNILVKSEDNGATWEYVSDISDFTNDTIEVGLEYLGDNNVIAVLRDLDNTVTYKATSSDMGATWSALSDVTSTLEASGRHRIYTLAHLKGEAEWWNDDTLVMVGFVLTNPGSSTGRHNALWVSEDAGSTWTLFYLDNPTNDGGYGDILYDSTNDELVYVTYHGDFNAASLKQYRLKLTGVE